MNKKAIIGDIKQLFSELPYEQKLLYRYGYISSSELLEEFEWSLEECDQEELNSISEDIFNLKRQSDG
jgi:hypothetical protein